MVTRLRHTTPSLSILLEQRDTHCFIPPAVFTLNKCEMKWYKKLIYNEMIVLLNEKKVQTAQLSNNHCGDISNAKTSRYRKNTGNAALRFLSSLRHEAARFLTCVIPHFYTRCRTFGSKHTVSNPSLPFRGASPSKPRQNFSKADILCSQDPDTFCSHARNYMFGLTPNLIKKRPC